MKQWSWVAGVVLVLSSLGCGGTPERKDVSVQDLEQKAAAGAKINSKGAEMRLEQQREREGGGEQAAQ